jgi:hypothetical protein
VTGDKLSHTIAMNPKRLIVVPPRLVPASNEGGT